MKRTAAIFFFLLCAAHAQARTLYVSLTGSHDTNAPAFSTWATAATNIQAAIDAASGGDTVRVAHGTYYSDNGTNDIISITNKTGLSVIGGHGTLFDADRTILDAGGSASARPIYVNAASNRVAGFTAMNTKAEDAVLLWVSSVNCTLDSLIVRNNDMSGTTYGCGIKNIGGPGNEIRNCIVVGNGVGTASLCAGICNQMHLTGVGISRVANCVVEANTKKQLYGHSGTLTVANTIYGNVGGVIGFSGGNLTSNTTNSVMQALGIAPASEGVGTNLVWAGVAAYMPRLGSLARKNGQPYAGIETASDGAGGPALVTSRPFIGRDATTNLNHGAAIGGVTASTNSPFAGERSAAFDGNINSEIFFGARQSVNVVSNFTFEVWAAKGSNIFERFLSNSTVAGIPAYELGSNFSNPNQWRLILNNNAVLLADITYSQWIHIAVVRDGSQIVFFQNGSPISTATYATAISGHGVLSTKRQSPSSYGGLGATVSQLSDLRIWNVARTPAEIQANYTNRLTGTEPGLVGYWPLKDPVINLIDTGPFNLDNPIIHPTYMEAF